MSGYRHELLGSASAKTVAFAAELTGVLEPPTWEKKHSKPRALRGKSRALRGKSGLVNVAGAGAFAVTVGLAGLTAAPQEALALPAAICNLTPPIGATATAPTDFACGPYAFAGVQAGNVVVA